MAERKKFIDVEIPMLSSDIKILTSEKFENKTIKLDLTRKMKGKGLTITFRIFNDDKKIIAIPCRMELVKSYIKRIMRKRADYVEDSFLAQCADIKATIKPFLITRKKVSRAIRKNLRNNAREFLTEYVRNKDYTELCNELKNGSLQKTMIPKLKKIYPLSFCDIRVFETKEIQKIDLKKASKKDEVAQEEEDVEEYVSFKKDEEE
ncbi:MAG: hypothetical protein Q8N88_03520 [Nanoarchaeota archaeon]|nr:hypothetical protein [Nanoarchaeota archaeon]